MKNLTLIFTLTAIVTFTSQAQNYKVDHPLQNNKQKPYYSNSVATVVDVRQAPKICYHTDLNGIRGKAKCENQGYLITFAYLDEHDKFQYHTVRSDRMERKGDLLNIEIYKNLLIY